jgi:hypothetical protein
MAALTSRRLITELYGHNRRFCPVMRAIKILFEPVTPKWHEAPI